MAWTQFSEDPFKFLDKTEFRIFGQDLNILKKHAALRTVILQLALFTGALWVILGFDSGVGMFEYPAYHLIEFITGKITFNEWIGWAHWAYGKTMHWSAFTIYGLLYVLTSNHLETELNIVGSKNSCLSYSFMFANIALFEYYWIYGFAIFQNQRWVATWKWPQARILIQNLTLFLCGIIGVLYLWADSHEYDDKGKAIKKLYSFKPNNTLKFTMLLTVISAVFWIFYPYSSPSFSVDIVGMSEWHSTPYFPQTLYTIDTDITDNINAGEWFYFENDMIHLTNTIVKVLFAYSGYIFVSRWRP